MKLVPRIRPYYGIEELLAAFNFFKKNQRKIFEEEFARKFENKFAIFLPYGRVALYLFLKALNIKGKEIICPAFTCNTVAQAIVLSGNIPVFIDCDRNSFNMNIQLVERNISKKTAAIVAVHMFGYPLDVITLNDIVKESENKTGRKIHIIQDVAQSFGATWKGHLPTRFGDVSIFGLGISKIINSISGGILTTNDEEIYKLIKETLLKSLEKPKRIDSLKKLLKFLSYFLLIRENSYFVVDFLERTELLSFLKKYYKEDVIEFPDDWNLIPSEIQARVGLAQLKKYDTIITIKRENAKRWMERLKGTDVHFFPYNPEATYSRFVGLSKRRNYWIDFFRKKGFQLGIVNYLLPYMKSFRLYKKGNYPVALKYNMENIIFPS
jgi:dTDP-4-amino-4,6-dideoxygalactose transaminase